MNTMQTNGAFFVHERSIERGKNIEKSKSKSNSRLCSNIECYHCYKKGHMKKDCRLWKKEKGSDKKNMNKEEKSGSNIKIEKVKIVSEAKEGEILFTLSMDNVHLVALDDSATHDWVLDNGASFHVTQNKDWFIEFDASRRGQVWLKILKDVRHVLTLTKNLVNSKQLDEASYTCTFGDDSWKISKGF